MKPVITRFFRNSVGAAAVEFALVAPILLLTTVGTIQLSIVLFAKHQLADGLDRARRSLQIDTTKSTDELKNTIVSHNLFDSEKIEVTTETVTLTNGKTVTKITVSAEIDFSIDILRAEWTRVTEVTFVTN